MYKSIVILLLFFVLTLPAHADHAVNINTADTETLATLTGIGDVKAQNIIDYREGANGPFETKEEVQQVSGIGPATYEDIKDHIVLSGGSSTTNTTQDSTQNDTQSNTESDSSENTTQPSSATHQPTPKPYEPPPSISVHAGADRTVFVGADSTFNAQVLGFENEPIENARVVWSFGDGSRAEGARVAHHFLYPGAYIVYVNAVSGHYSANDRVHINAIPARISIPEVTHKYIALKNESGVEVDIGGWILFSAGTQFQFPQHTIIADGQTVFISNKHTGLSGAQPETVALQYPNGVVATSYQYPLFINRSHTPPTAKKRVTQPAASPAAATPSETSEESIDSTTLTAAPALADTARSSAPSGGLPPILGWLTALAALVVLATLGVLFARHSSTLSGWRIREIKDETHDD
ncbi:MAG: helix-hairpin-helix domain-containing protein [Patescibacteria group bacterium UBA2163]